MKREGKDNKKSSKKSVDIIMDYQRKCNETNVNESRI